MLGRGVLWTEVHSWPAKLRPAALFCPVPSAWTALREPLATGVEASPYRPSGQKTNPVSIWIPKPGQGPFGPARLCAERWKGSYQGIIRYDVRSCRNSRAGGDLICPQPQPCLKFEIGCTIFSFGFLLLSLKKWCIIEVQIMQ